MNQKQNSKGKLWLVASIAVCGVAMKSQGAIELFEWGVNGDTTIYKNQASLPGYINGSGFNFSTGEGTITATFANPGAHYFAFYVDHEIDQGLNTFFNEFGQAVNTPKAKQTWEIDEPGFVYGDIYQNFLAGTLDNKNGVPASAPDDVALALAWGFKVDPSEQAIIQMQIIELPKGSPPLPSFYLQQTDPDSDFSIYFSSTLGFSPVIPEPGTLLAGALALFPLGAASLRALRRTRKIPDGGTRGIKK